MKPMYLSQDQHDTLTAELRQLKSKERPAIIRAIAEAREHGDLKENAEYAAAKEKQELVEGKISRLEETLSRARIMTEDMINSGLVQVGNKIKLIDKRNNEEMIYELVPTAEFNTFDPDAVSVDSPVGKALIGKKIGDTVAIKVPAGILTYKIMEIM